MRRCSVALLIVLVVQLTLGASMRHYKAGLAIPDFPTAYGGVLPPLNQAGIQDAMIEFSIENDEFILFEDFFSPAQVAVHAAHRFWSVVVIGACAWVFWVWRRSRRRDSYLGRPIWVLGGLLFVQLALGASVIWSARHPEIATAHQSVGAALLAAAALLTIRVHLPQPMAGNGELTQDRHKRRLGDTATGAWSIGGLSG